MVMAPQRDVAHVAHVTVTNDGTVYRFVSTFDALPPKHLRFSSAFFTAHSQP